VVVEEGRCEISWLSWEIAMMDMDMEGVCGRKQVEFSVVKIEEQRSPILFEFHFSNSIAVLIIMK
jgi:hypothetical protein